MGRKTPVAVIEAKALGKPLDEKETMQALNYANTAGIPYMTLTNGDHWRMLEVFKQAPIKRSNPDEFPIDARRAVRLCVAGFRSMATEFGEWGSRKKRWLQ